ncbi:restriction endonuclease subunit S [Mitsuokella multacida]|uniref:restriction endonuclease subunit S n=1 Tax=Mitsuokella multacida TaxID=52226 RepID=UPI0026E0B1F0|nr:restriction endonuclease subunit S [Mitsuokella multacida]
MKWKRLTIGDHCTVTSSKRFHISDRSSHGVPFYCSKEIIQMFNGEQVDETDYISEDAYEQIKKRYGIPKEGDLLITTRGTLGIPYLYKRNDRFYFADGNLTWLKDFDDELSAEYLYYWLQSYTGKKKIEAIAKGTAQKAVPISAIQDLIIEAPNVHHQLEIIDKILPYDRLIKNNRLQIKLLEEAAQRLYKEWFIDHHFPGYENVKIVDSIPEGWNIRKLADVADIIMGQSPTSDTFNLNRNGLPFHQGVGSYGNRYVKNKVYTTSYTRIANADSILFSVRAPVGRLNVTKNKIVIGRGLAAFYQKQGYQNYLFYMLKEHYFKDDLIGNGSIFSSITKNELMNQKFIIPDTKTMLAYDNIAKIIDKKIDNLDCQIDLISEARNRLLPKLMSGEIEI